MSKDPKILPRSHAQEEIISILISKGIMRFTELQNHLRLSRPAISRHLNALLKQDIIEFTKKGREKHYKLKNFTKSTFEKKMIAFSAHYAQDYIMILEDRRKKEKKVSEAYEEIASNLNAYFLYLILKSLQTGDNWFEGFDSNRMAFITTNYLMSLAFNSEPAPIMSLTPYTKEHMKELFNDMNKMLLEQNLKDRPEKFLGTLQKLYPKQIKLIHHIEEKFLNGMS